ncbi:MAG: TetR/AcrR family transcriptional regulator C-terminal ligand-binding domain-containing protein, partial [Planctomycetota bacterium]
RHAWAGTDGGCLFTQTMARGDRDDPSAPDATARAYTGRLRKALTAALRRAVADGQLRPEADAAGLADAILTLAFGVAVVGRGGMPGSMIDHAVNAALSLIDAEQA